jgi:hypothetical protein
MRLRIAKKVLNFGANARFRKNYMRKKYLKVRSPRYRIVDGEQRLVFPSLHDIPIIRAAWRKINKRYNKYNK